MERRPVRDAGRARCINTTYVGSLGVPMRTTIEIDDDLLAVAMAATGLTSPTATVEAALRRLVRHDRQTQAVADMAGLGWEGNLDAMRAGRRSGADR